jgi:hypothetical protein
MGNFTQVMETFAEFDFSPEQMTAIMGAHAIGKV